ncbi:MAG: DNA polymerase III subunit [Patescibacteria group bacterium]|nr:DNA polymerase III subunit [Patescibacteria group bacterium]
MADTKDRFDWPPIGQDKAVAFLDKSLISGKLAQTYIFAGPRDLGKSSLALAFARNLWQSDRRSDASGNFESLNSDLYILEKDADKQAIGVEATRNFIKRLGLSSFMNSYKIGIVKEAETLSAESQSALLKTLEEPRTQVVIILLTEKLESLLPTIISRSQVLYFQPVKSAAVYDYLLASLDIKRSTAKELAAASLGRPLQALHWAENQDSYHDYFQLVNQLFTFLKSDLASRLDFINRESGGDKLSVEDASLWLDIWESLWRDALLLSLGQEEYLRYPSLAESWQSNFNLSAESVLDRLRQLVQARRYLQGSVNPKNILESLAIYF